MNTDSDLGSVEIGSPGEVRAVVDQTLAWAIDLLPAAGPLAPAHRVLQRCRHRFASRVRVALIGRIGSGKSTLANALLGEEVMPTGLSASTRSATWFSRGIAPELTVHYQNQGTARNLSPTLAELADLVCGRRRADSPGIAYVAYSYPNDNLDWLDLIDTPGLDAAGEVDPGKIRRFLATEADVLVHVFAGGPGAMPQELMRDFQLAVGTSEVARPNATIGALTMVENYWRADRQDVMTVGRTVTRQIRAEGGSKRFYQLHPVASLVAVAACTFDAEDFADLTKLADVGSDLLTDCLKYGPRFAGDAAAQLPVPAGRRAALYDRFGAHGIAEACRLIKGRQVSHVPTLRRLLYERSGMADFRRLLTEQFGERAELLKVVQLVSQVRTLARDLKFESDVELPARALGDLSDVVAAITGLVRMPALGYLSVICDYHRGVLEFSEQDAKEAMQILGEFGLTLADRLNLAENASPAELVSEARRLLRRWRGLQQTAGYRNDTRLACEIVVECCNRLVDAATRPQ